MAGEGEVHRLVAALRSGTMEERHRAEDILKEIGVPAVDPLIRALREMQNPDFRWYAARSLARIGAPAVEPLVRALREEKDRE
ncbi:MAG: HEAT repeat domain-containing protein, partial [Methanomicrobiales archaeon]|nr:HEAT repeat domain-containing protein [Methanomicrobiales archaeon]